MKTLKHKNASSNRSLRQTLSYVPKAKSSFVTRAHLYWSFDKKSPSADGILFNPFNRGSIHHPSFFVFAFSFPKSFYASWNGRCSHIVITYEQTRYTKVWQLIMIRRIGSTTIRASQLIRNRKGMDSSNSYPILSRFGWRVALSTTLMRLYFERSCIMFSTHHLSLTFARVKVFRWNCVCAAYLFVYELWRLFCHTAWWALTRSSFLSAPNFGCSEMRRTHCPLCKSLIGYHSWFRAR